MNNKKKHRTYVNRLFLFLYQAAGCWVLFFLSVTLTHCINDSSSSKGRTGENGLNAETVVLQLPDTLLLKKLLDTALEKRKLDKDSVLIYYFQIENLCLPVMTSTVVPAQKRKVYSSYYIHSLNNKGLLYYFYCEYDSAMNCFERAESWAGKEAAPLLVAESLFYIAEVYLEQGDYEKAIRLYAGSMDIYNVNGDALSVFYCLNSIGIVHKLQGDYNKALESYDKAYSIADSLNNNPCRAFILNNKGNVFKSRGEFSAAMDNFDHAYQIFTGLNELLPASDCLENMGDVSMETGNYQRAISYYNNSLGIVDSAGDNYRKVALYKSLGEVYTIISDFGQAGNYFEMAVSLAEKIGERVRLAACLKSYGRLYEKQGAFTRAAQNYQMALGLATEFNDRKETADISNALAANALNRGKTGEALTFAQKAFLISSEIGALKEKKQALKLLADIYLVKADTSKAYVYFKAFSEVKDTLAAISELETIETIEARHQLKDKETENLLLKAESETRLQKLKQNKTIAFALAAGLGFLTLIAFLLYRRIQDSRILFQQKEEINRQKMLELNIEIDYKNRELTSKALHLVQKDEMIGNISERLHGILGGNGNTNREINSIIWEMKSDIQKNNWNEFEHHFLKVHPDFYHRLLERFPSLTTNERKICAFLKLNLKTKDISSITGQSVKSIEVARTRLRSRFNLASDDNLNAFIGSF